ncbi:DUF5675 family protein [Flavobacterium taihuense]|uniref:DUF5675 family protein n=1 Tax=Flavobacterium taihuense TaxID=2857508 RepID=UPI003F72B175
MVLILNRTYFPEGTQGTLEWNGTIVCHAIELPWLENQQRVSCIPEGEYVLRKRFSPQVSMAFAFEKCSGKRFNFNPSRQ